ncbi:hypothetical protein FDP41_000071 [Naegleria fowleri]|uniref:Uncharacterized protein n=1 Tax=Naegleria fowleri TaxID=5763 RepID=A0A6A5CD64_NAEFO|nr:uncharacterized protein FDP41_000071 [Naegleria fowleri]KAF0985032.1 hypothetical protein FDP41_000071 [Naegleria fowleri]CAG4717912.1 unnamed protein product [Naegleria fowleri]
MFTSSRILRFSLAACRKSTCSLLPSSSSCVKSCSVVATHKASSLSSSNYQTGMRFFSTNNNMTREETGDSEVKGIITPDLFNKNRNELKQLFMTELEKIVTKITQEDGYTPHDIYNFALGEHNLRFKVFKAAMARFGREIPNTDLPKILKVRDLVEWFIVKVEKERPPQTYEVPENVKLFIDKHQGKKLRKLNENAFSVPQESSSEQPQQQ